MREPDRPVVEVRRSARRVRTVTAYRRDGKVIVMIPDRFTRRQESEWVEKMLAKLDRKGVRNDEELLDRARRLSASYLHGRADPVTVRWVTNQRFRWGSCTSAEGSIRLSHELKRMPEWVVDYVLLHELAHLIEPGHNKAFWSLLESYPQAEKAKGFLEGWSAARSVG